MSRLPLCNTGGGGVAAAAPQRHDNVINVCPAVVRAQREKEMASTYCAKTCGVCQVQPSARRKGQGVVTRGRATIVAVADCCALLSPLSLGT